MKRRLQKYSWLAALIVLPLASGCLNPEFLNTAVGSYYPVAPGEQPFVMVRVVNDTSAVLDIPITYDIGTSTPLAYAIQTLTPEARDTGVLLEWPVLRVALGDLDNPFLPLITATFPDQTTIGVAFNQAALEAGVDYNQGDTIIFHFTADSRNASYIRVSVGLIDGDTQTGDFSRGDPFERLYLWLLANGF